MTSCLVIPSPREGLEAIIEEKGEEDNHQGQHHLSSCADICFLLEDCIILAFGVKSLRGA